MRNSSPWLKRRFNKFLFLINDFSFNIIFISILNYLEILNIEFYKIIILLFLILPFRYLNNKYEIINANNKNFKFFPYIFESFFILLIFNFEEKYFIFPFLIIYFILNNLFAIFFKYIYRKVIDIRNHDKFLFLGSYEDYKLLQDEINKEGIYLKIIYVKKFHDLNSLQKKINKNPYLITDNLNEEFKLLELYFKILTSLDFYQEYFERIPSNSKFDLKKFNFRKKSFYNFINFYLKRFFDVLFSITLLLVASPLLIIIYFLMKIENKGPFLYTQIRSGLNNKPLKILKIRTMYTNSEDKGFQWSTKNDPRITKIGGILRALKIDELPQLISVIKGEMSLIGPRPERPEFDKILKEKINNYYIRYKMKPGLSGWYQVKMIHSASIEDSDKKISYDLYYMKNFSICLDLLIFIKTIRIVLNAKG